MSAPKVDIHGILERAGADANAPQGSQAWALGQVDAAVAELIEAAAELEPNAGYFGLRLALLVIGDLLRAPCGIQGSAYHRPSNHNS